MWRHFLKKVENVDKGFFEPQRAQRAQSSLTLCVLCVFAVKNSGVF
jgi:hypothetical protein